MRQNLLILLITLLFGACTSAGSGQGESRSTLFDDGWLFSLGDDPQAATPGYDDTSWRQLNLPHDWAIEGDFSKDNPSGTGGGALPGGIGWYRKHFTIPQSDRGKVMRIDFEGVYMNASVYINGHLLGTRPYGYISFSYDLTPYIKYDGENVLAVRVDNAEQPNSRWYSGCGIYRHVWLTKMNAIHVDQWGTFVRTGEVSSEQAKITVSTQIRYDFRKPESPDETNAREGSLPGAGKIILSTTILDADQRNVASISSHLMIQPGERKEVTHDLFMNRPTLWDLDNPYLYTVLTEITDSVSGRLIDSYTTPMGIRTFAFDVQEGFKLNGHKVKINGACMHHDFGCLGAAFNRRAAQRQLEILKEMGCNGIRCSHNPPAPELLDLCDRMGFIVMDETFDMWRKKKTSHDYARYFNEWHERDLTDLVVRDRNHPSIFIWSIGNEVLEQWSDANADTLSLEEANMILNFGHGKDMLAKEGGEMSVNSLLTKKLADMTRALDPTRPVTAGCNEPDPGNHLFRSGALDLIGFNYHDAWFEDVSKNFPGKPFIVTESVSALMTRGYYKMPSDKEIICPERWDIPYYDSTFMCSAYDNCHVPWGNRHEGTLKLVEENDFISGQYIWTGFDYIGEPTPYGWPARSSYFGIVDLAGFPKDVYYMYQSVWRPDKTVLHIFPHWNWKPGETVDIWAYYNNADEVELLLNGKSLGSQRKADGTYHVSWRVPFEKGELEAISRKDGQVVARQTIRTAGEPCSIRLTPDRTDISADGRDLSFVTVEVVDKDGNLCPLADHDISFNIQGKGFIAGVDNGSPISLERFKADHRKAFHGKCLVVIQSNGQQGGISLEAKAEGLESCKIGLIAKK